jgi:hypothetical protein
VKLREQGLSKRYVSEGWHRVQRRNGLYPSPAILRVRNEWVGEVRRSLSGRTVNAIEMTTAYDCMCCIKSDNGSVSNRTLRWFEKKSVSRNKSNQARTTWA